MASWGRVALVRTETPGLEMHGCHAADFAFVGRHQLHLDGHVLARLHGADSPDQLTLRPRRCHWLGVLETRTLGNLVADLDVRGGHGTHVSHVDFEDGGPSDLNLRRGDLLHDQLRRLRAFEFLGARLAGPRGRNRSGKARLDRRLPEASGWPAYGSSVGRQRSRAAGELRRSPSANWQPASAGRQTARRRPAALLSCSPGTSCPWALP